LGAIIVGISKDSMKSHMKFSEKFTLNFHLLSDPEKEVHHQFDVIKEKKLYGKISLGTVRSTFIINEEGVLIKEYRKVKAKGHAEQVLKDMKEM
jgi:peroxiredoxin Q/BCP